MASRYEVMPIEPRAVSQLSFITAVALYEMLWPLVVDVERKLKIKWPNDLMYDGRKLCGILIQSQPVREPGHMGIAIGIGINIACAPQVNEYETVALNDILCCEPMEVEPLLHKLDKHLTAVLALWYDKGFDPIRQTWFKRAYGRPGQIKVSSDGVSVTGILKGIDSYGALVVKGNDGHDYTITGGKIEYGEQHASGD